jgi:hypothetical protein
MIFSYKIITVFDSENNQGIIPVTFVKHIIATSDGKSIMMLNSKQVANQF